MSWLRDKLRRWLGVMGTPSLDAPAYVPLTELQLAYNRAEFGALDRSAARSSAQAAADSANWAADEARRAERECGAGQGRPPHRSRIIRLPFPEVATATSQRLLQSPKQDRPLQRPDTAPQDGATASRNAQRACHVALLSAAAIVLALLPFGLRSSQWRKFSREQLRSGPASCDSPSADSVS